MSSVVRTSCHFCMSFIEAAFFHGGYPLLDEFCFLVEVEPGGRPQGSTGAGVEVGDREIEADFVREILSHFGDLPEPLEPLAVVIPREAIDEVEMDEVAFVHKVREN